MLRVNDVFVVERPELEGFLLVLPLIALPKQQLEWIHVVKSDQSATVFGFDFFAVFLKCSRK